MRRESATLVAYAGGILTATVLLITTWALTGQHPRVERTGAECPTTSLHYL